MADYGHDLVFGTFVAPTAEHPDQAVTLAQLTEQVGLDLVTFQDHPYQPAFLDTWTLLSYVAARTERVQLAPNVSNLPLRPPAVLARAAASLDLLSGGRFALGLGAGAFWDAIEAMGGRRLAPGESIEALDEAISIIRALWDVDTRGGARVDGEHYRVAGAKRGPAPAHAISIWVGAYKPRMLRLVGRSADGWLPSLGYLSGPEALTGLNAIIDESASGAGRDPRAIRRLLNIGEQDLNPEHLAEIALEHGTSTFILGSDDARTIQDFGEQVAPAVRDLVAAERGRGTKASDDREVSAAGSSVRDSRAAVTSGLGVTPTPDDGTRLSAAMPWDESTRPQAPAPPDGRDYTDHGRAVGQHLIDVHDGLRAELERVRDLVEQVRSGSMGLGAARSAINEMTLRQNNWTLGAYCESYCRIVTAHHSLEDTGIFPHLRESDAGVGAVIDRLEEEHRVIHDVLDGVDRALVALVGAPGDLRPLEDAVDLLTDTLLSHLAYEERELVEPLARLGMYSGQL